MAKLLLLCFAFASAADTKPKLRGLDTESALKTPADGVKSVKFTPRPTPNAKVPSTEPVAAPKTPELAPPDLTELGPPEVDDPAQALTCPRRRVTRRRASGLAFRRREARRRHVVARGGRDSARLRLGGRGPLRLGRAAHAVRLRVPALRGLGRGAGLARGHQGVRRVPEHVPGLRPDVRRQPHVEIVV
mmetsp:Transcript_8041/g.24026  ORF Transcript_8041/g.24026 Transcript_8041/m.24026 type:complete len:189 (-) Transcript_8041:633-1199(-)